MIAMALAHKYTGRSYPEIGRFFQKDHTSVMNAVVRLPEIRKLYAFGSLITEAEAILTELDRSYKESEMKQIKIYFASKRRHAEKLAGYRINQIHICARWIETANLGMNKSKPAAHWMEENFIDIQASDYVLVYAEEADTLETALVEVGWAMAFSKPVIVIGDHDSYKPWRANFKRVSFQPTIEDALNAIVRQNTSRRDSLDHEGRPA
jgi:nucleoside 2-deoxyribosyltransferase